MFTPGYYVGAVGFTISALLLIVTNYFVHRGAWTRLKFFDAANTIKPRVYCMPLCCSAWMCHRFNICRPRLTKMLRVSEVCGYISAIALALFGIVSERMNEQFNFAAFCVFAALLMVYMLVLTINQHNIKVKCVVSAFTLLTLISVV
mgnify:CR=1 FL=1